MAKKKYKKYTDKELQEIKKEIIEKNMDAAEILTTYFGVKKEDISTIEQFGKKYNIPDAVEAEELQMKVDREYFEKYPTKTSYVRAFIPGESEEVTKFVLVKQIAPGVRQRIGIDDYPAIEVREQKRSD